MDETLFLDVGDVLGIHRIVLEKYGGLAGVRDRNMLLSAVNQPQQTFEGQFLYDSIPKMAATYAFHISENQPFVDGNKRTAFAASNVFLKLNGFRLDASDEEVYQLFIDLANKKITKDDFFIWYENTSIS
ncbi:MAG: type II toxin-antitoxin system death-on-curing family toxin [bacterium]